MGEARPDRVVRGVPQGGRRSEEHTSELQSQSNLVCRLLLEKKKNKDKSISKGGEYIGESGGDTSAVSVLRTDACLIVLPLSIAIRMRTRSYNRRSPLSLIHV